MLYTIENDYLKVTIASLGATITKFIEKSSNVDIVLGFESEEEYTPENSPFFGATVGRCANRIGKGTYFINGVEYHAPINDNGVNTLHGGEGFAFKQFEMVNKTDTNITFHIFSKDGEDGFPGNLNVNVIYELIDNKLTCTFKAISDKDTLLNLTNHSYFNLNGDSSDVLDHELQINSDYVALLDENGMSLADTLKVDSTPFDFREFKKIKDNLTIGHDNLACGGIDHNFVYEVMGPKKLLTLRNDSLSLDVYSDLPDCQLYTSCTMGDINGKYGNKYHQYSGAAIEPQYYPNAINYDKYLKPIAKANEEIEHYIEYVVEKR